MSHPVPTITIETLFPALSKKNSDVVALIKIAHPAMAALKSSRTKLNIVFAIDVSGSMSGILSNSAVAIPEPVVPIAPVQPMPGRIDPFGPMLGGQRYQPFMPQLQGRLEYKTKLDRVKAATIKAISQLQEDDRFGIVTFDGQVRTVVESTLATAEAKSAAIAKINQLHAGSSTALHAGWKSAAEMV